MSKIKLGSSYYELVFEDVVYINDKRVNGYINYEDGVIKVAATLPNVALEETLIHEILHGIETEYALELEEREIQLLSRGIISMIIDNKGLMEQIVKDIRRKIKKVEAKDDRE